MDEFEHVTCMCNASLQSAGARAARRKYLVLGTSNVMGEEMGSRGRV